MKNKLLISFILFVVILSFFTCSFASVSDTFEFTYNENNYFISIPSDINCSEVNYYFCIKYGPYFYVYCVTNDNFNVIKVGDKENGSKLYPYIIICDDIGNVASPSDNLGYFFLYNPNTGSYTNTSIMTGSANCINSFLDRDSFSFLYSSIDVYDYGGNLVFQGAPHQGVVIQGIQQVEEIPQMMGQVMKILIPIGLIVFSIGFVIYLTRLVISRVQ